MQEERKRVLEMQEEGVISAEEAAMLLEQLGEGDRRGAEKRDKTVHEERKRVFEILEEGTISAEEAGMLLEQLVNGAGKGSIETHEERKRVLDILEEGTISAEEAGMLLERLGNPGARGPADLFTPPEPADLNPKNEKMLRVRIHVVEEGNPNPTNVNINLPLKLARVAGRLIAAMPESAHAAMRVNGVDLGAIDWKSIIDDLAESGGDIVNITHDDGREQAVVRIYIA